MTDFEFEFLWDQGELDEQYLSYVLNQEMIQGNLCSSEYLVDSLESYEYVDDFKEWMVREGDLAKEIADIAGAW